MENNIIAIVGMAGSGKSEAAGFFSKKGYKVIRFGSVIMDAIKEASLQITPENEERFRSEIRTQQGMAAIAIRLYPTIIKALILHDVVLDGLYNWEEYTYLKNKIPNLELLAIYAGLSIRYSRLQNRPERPFTPEEARARDIHEIEKINKAGPIAISDYLIKNEGTLTEFHTQLEEFVSQLKNEK